MGEAEGGIPGSSVAHRHGLHAALRQETTSKEVAPSTWTPACPVQGPRMRRA